MIVKELMLLDQLVGVFLMWSSYSTPTITTHIQLICIDGDNGCASPPRNPGLTPKLTPTELRDAGSNAETINVSHHTRTSSRHNGHS